MAKGAIISWDVDLEGMKHFSVAGNVWGHWKLLSGLDFSPSGPVRPLGTVELFEPGGRGSQGGRVKQKQSKQSKAKQTCQCI